MNVLNTQCPPLPQHPRRRVSLRFWLAGLGLAIGLIFVAESSFAQTGQTTMPVAALKKMSMEQLLDLEVTSVSRRAEKLSETASAIQVITGEDIHRSGATSLPYRMAQIAAEKQYAFIVINRDPSLFTEMAEASPRGLVLLGSAGEYVPRVVDAMLSA